MQNAINERVNVGNKIVHWSLDDQIHNIQNKSVQENNPPVGQEVDNPIQKPQPRELDRDRPRTQLVVQVFCL